MAQRTRKAHRKPLMAPSGVNEQLHEVGLLVDDPAVWMRTDLDVVVDVPLMTNGVEHETNYQLRFSGYGPYSVISIVSRRSGRVLAHIGEPLVKRFLDRAVERCNFEGNSEAHQEPSKAEAELPEPSAVAPYTPTTDEEIECFLRSMPNPADRAWTQQAIREKLQANQCLRK